MRLDPESLRAFANRDWGAPERLARRHRAAQPVARKVAIAVELYEAYRSAKSGWPDDVARRRDLASHIALRQRLMRAAHVGAR